MKRLFRIKAILPDGMAERFNLDCPERDLFENVRAKISEALKSQSFRMFWKDDQDKQDGCTGVRIRSQADMLIALEDNEIAGRDAAAPILKVYVELVGNTRRKNGTGEASRGHKTIADLLEVFGRTSGAVPPVPAKTSQASETAPYGPWNPEPNTVILPNCGIASQDKWIGKPWLHLGIRYTTTPRVLKFSGRDWFVKPSCLSESWQHGQWEADNNWNEKNAWVDENGLLHLKLTQVEGKWYGAHLYTMKKLGLGHYQFHVEGRIDQLDRNVAFVLSSRRNPENGQQGTNEIALEVSKWGISDGSAALYTVFPPDKGVHRQYSEFRFGLNGPNTTHSFEWNPHRVVCTSAHGHQNRERNHVFGKWDYHPTAEEANLHIPKEPQEVCLTLCLYDGLSTARRQRSRDYRAFVQVFPPAVLKYRFSHG